MATQGWDERLRASPELFPLDIDPSTDRVEFRVLTPLDYEKASFLDRRLTQPVAGTAAFAELAAVARPLSPACDFIFHIGHAGSTLVSRLLGQHPSMFSIREPQALRTLAAAELAGGPWNAAALDERLSTLLALYARTWRPQQRALVKATSAVGEVAERLLRLTGRSRALMITLRPQTYLAAILGGPNSRVELAGAVPSRMARLRRRFPDAAWTTDSLSEGEAAAMSWLCEMSGLAAATSAYGGRAAWLDFDVLLHRPAEVLGGALGFLRGPDAARDGAGLAASAYFGRYSKAPEYAFGPQTRREVLATAAREHSAEIARGLAWLDGARADARLASIWSALEATVTHG